MTNHRSYPSDKSDDRGIFKWRVILEWHLGVEKRRNKENRYKPLGNIEQLDGEPSFPAKVTVNVRASEVTASERAHVYSIKPLTDHERKGNCTYEVTLNDDNDKS